MIIALLLVVTVMMIITSHLISEETNQIIRNKLA